MKFRYLFSLLALCGLPVVCMATKPAPRTVNITFTVNSVADSVDANPGDGVCQDLSGQCSLRAAIMEANAVAGPDTIVFDPITDGQPQLLQLHGAGEDAAATGDLDITDGLTITGNGTDKTIIDGDAADRVFDILPASGTITVEIDDLTVQNGNGVTKGGGLEVRCATLVLNGDLIENNLALNASGTALGGGIYGVGSPVTLDHTIVKSNNADANTGGLGGGIATEAGTVSGCTSDLHIIDGSLVSNNVVQGGSTGLSSAVGGGVATYNSPLTMDSSAVRDNLATDTSSGGNAYGGGIGSFGNTSNGVYSISNSEISGNTVHGYTFAFGGGMDSEYVTADSSLVNTTISGNSAMADSGSAYGGGISMDSTPTGVTESLDNVTIAGNSVSATGSGGGGLDVYSNQGTVLLQDSLVSGNTDASATAPDCYGSFGGTLASGGYNLIGDGTGCTFSNATGDQIGTGSAPIDPLLGALADNGGKTQTMTLLAGSPAVDAGNPAGCADASGAVLTRDQRNYPRPEDGNASGTAICDIGAYEHAADTPPSASDGSVTTTPNTAATGVLMASDGDNDSLTYSIVSQPAHGTVTINNSATGAFSYVPAAKYKGSDSFTFSVNDGFVDSNVATETVTVNAAPSSGGGGGFGALALIALLLLTLLPKPGNKRLRQ